MKVVAPPEDRNEAGIVQDERVSGFEIKRKTINHELRFRSLSAVCVVGVLLSLRAFLFYFCAPRGHVGAGCSVDGISRGHVGTGRSLDSLSG